jgi:hypothetical protein
MCFSKFGDNKTPQINTFSHFEKTNLQLANFSQEKKNPVMNRVLFFQFFHIENLANFPKIWQN